MDRPKFNFGPASARDGIVFASGSPGAGPPPPSSDGVTQPKAIPAGAVSEWTSYMKSQGVARVVCLLTDVEVGLYADPLLVQYRMEFGEDAVVNVPISDPDARRRILRVLCDSADKKLKVVVQCSSGQERSGNVLAAWLQHKYLLTAQEAVAEVISFASTIGSVRRPTVDGVMRLFGSAAGAGPGPGDGHRMRRMSSSTTTTTITHRMPSTPSSRASVSSHRIRTAPRPPQRGRGRAVPPIPIPSPSPVTPAGMWSSVSGRSKPPSPVRSTARSSYASRPPPKTGSSTYRSGPAPQSSRTSLDGLSVRLGLRAQRHAVMSKHVTFVQMGGTIDKDYPRSLGGYAFEIGESAVPRILMRLHVPVPFPFTLTTVCQKDSQEIGDDDRTKLLDACCKSSGDRVIITHGTDTLIETARFLQAAIRVAHETRGKPPADGKPEEKKAWAVRAKRSRLLRDKVIVLTGAMRPERFAESDAALNVGAALASVSLLPPGVYVTMHGQVFDPNDVMRIPANGCFVTETEQDVQDTQGDAADEEEADAGEASLDVDEIVEVDDEGGEEEAKLGSA